MIELIILVVGITAGWYVREWYALRVMRKIVNNAQEQYKETIKESVIDAYIETAGDTFFVYRKEDNKFLAQGSDINTLSDILQEQFPGKYFNIPSDQLDMLERKK